MSDDRKHPVKYQRLPDIGFGFIPIIEEGEPFPEEKHYKEAERIEQQYQRAVATKPEGRT